MWEPMHELCGTMAMTPTEAASHRILSCGVVVVHWNRNHYDYLLLKAYNYWDFPKGMVELNESPLQAAVREVEEETTLTGLRFRWGDVYRETYPYNQGRKVARYYIAESVTTAVQLPTNPQLGRPEHSEYRWADHDEAWEMLTPRVRAILDWTDSVMARTRRR
ncbi:NUDIX hydrolase [Candidatus Competibacter denitrificans Run_A_D11]|uniref:Bis(5'-nucleosyl)-tetraphosphatase [asymmetrical] n=2 Tax=Candidatus Competibacter TaxID=221279 RepID=W6M659_9GAMM|nr:NUDIX hydrolase [Candidatus Competibacter denitrificans Run_A_D11]